MPPPELQRGRAVGESVFDTFPWPQKPKHEDIKALAEAAVTLRALRPETMRKLNYSLPPRAIFRLVFSVFSRCLPCLCLDCCGFASRMRRANALCTLLGAATSRCHSRSIALPIRSVGAFWCCVCARDRLRLAFADNPNLPFRVCAITGGGGDTFCISTSKSVVSVRAGVTNDVATSEVAKVLSASVLACCGTLPSWHKAKRRVTRATAACSTREHRERPRYQTLEAVSSSQLWN